MPSSSPRLHPRVPIVNSAKAELGLSLLDLEKKYGLTTAEIAQLLATAIAEMMVYAIRAERHPGNPNKRGGEE